MSARAEQDGKDLGAALVEEEQAVGEASGAMQWIAGAESARKGVISLRARLGRLSAEKVVAAKDGQLKTNAANEKAVVRRIGRLKGGLPPLRKLMGEQTKVITVLVDRYEALPRSAKGYMGDVFVVLGIELGVVTFDGGSLRAALVRSGYSEISVLFLSASVPALIFAANHALGVLAGVIGNKLGFRRLQVAVGTFAAGFGVLMLTFVLLAVFRDRGVAAENATLAKWAAGHAVGHDASFLISPVWLGPAQVAGSIAAIIAVAFWTLAKPGRELRGRIREERGELARREGAVRQVEGQIEAAHARQDALQQEAAQIEVTAAEAQAEIDAHIELVATQHEAESGLAEAARGRLREAFIYTATIYRNGGVIRAARATIWRFSWRITPPASDQLGQPYRRSTPASTGSNGHHATTPEDLAGLL
jgi:hypothetical protein